MSILCRLYACAYVYPDDHTPDANLPKLIETSLESIIQAARDDPSLIVNIKHPDGTPMLHLLTQSVHFFPPKKIHFLFTLLDALLEICPQSFMSGKNGSELLKLTLIPHHMNDVFPFQKRLVTLLLIHGAKLRQSEYYEVYSWAFEIYANVKMQTGLCRSATLSFLLLRRKSSLTEIIGRDMIRLIGQEIWRTRVSEKWVKIFEKNLFLIT